MSVIDPPPTEPHNTFHSDEGGNGACAEQASDPASTYEEHAGSASDSDSGSDAEAEETIEMLGKLPPEIGMLLVLSGIAGILLPGPVGTPLLIAGGVTIWPKTFQPIERWFSRRFPKAHHEGVFQIKEFVANLQQRFPASK
jgi:hypothetical protein